MIGYVKLYKNQYRFIIQKQAFRARGLHFLGPVLAPGPSSLASGPPRGPKAKNWRPTVRNRCFYKIYIKSSMIIIISGDV